jgi:DNA polymerase-4
VACGLLAREATGTAFPLIGIGAYPLLPLADADHGDLADLETPRQAAIDTLRKRFGVDAISRGRGREAASSPSKPIPRGKGE